MNTLKLKCADWATLIDNLDLSTVEDSELKRRIEAACSGAVDKNDDVSLHHLTPEDCEYLKQIAIDLELDWHGHTV